MYAHTLYHSLFSNSSTSSSCTSDITFAEFILCQMCAILTPFYQVGSVRDRSGGCTRASMHLRHTPHGKQIKFIIYTIYYIEKSAFTLIFTRPSAYPFDARTRRVTAPALLLRLPLGAPHTTHLTCPKQRAPRGRPGPRPSGGA